MVNTLGAYYSTGMKVAQATNRGDHALALHLQRWLRQALRLERPADALAAEAEYDRGYRDARHVPTPERFR